MENRQAEAERGAILERYHAVMEHLRGYAGARLVAVSKLQPRERVRALFEAGHRDFGENYLQEWLAKKDEFPGAHWHFIGRVQSRKVKALSAEGIYCVHGFGSRSSLEELHKLANPLPGGAFLQLNLAGEEQKNGASLADLETWSGEGLLRSIAGFMSLPPGHWDEGELTRHFRQMRAIKERYHVRELSMGTSADWRLALAEGATVIRLGTAIFGERRQP